MATQNQTKNPNLPNGYVSKGGADRWDSRESNQTTPSYMSSTPKAFKIQVHANKDEHNVGKKMTVAPNKIQTFENFLEECTKKLDPTFGAARRLYTSRGRRRINKLDELEEGNVYVITGNEKFRKINYKEIQEKTRANYNKNKKIEPRSYTPVQHAVKEEHRKKSGRYKSWSDKYKGKRIKVHVNNYWTKAAHPVTILPKDVNNLLEIFKTIEKEMNIYPIGRIFRIDNEGRRKEEDFTELHSAEEINHNEHVLVVPHADKRIEFNTYRFDGLQDFHISTSPRHDRGFGTVPFTPYKHNKSLNSHKKLPSIGSSKQSDAQSPFSNAGSRGGGGRGRNPNANPNPKSKTRQVDYDNDSGGVYRAKKQNNARGAQQVNETRDTRVDKPIDQMEAEIVEEEDINTKEKTTPIPPGTELNKQPSKETKQNADSQTSASKKNSQVKKDSKTDKKNAVSVLPPLVSDDEQVDSEKPSKKSKDTNVVKGGQVKDAVTKIETEKQSDASKNVNSKANTKTKTGDKLVDQRNGTDTEIKQIQGGVTPTGSRNDKPDGGAVTPSGKKSKNETNRQTPLPASPLEGKISRSSQTTKERMNEDAAATKIQAGARGYKARKEIKELKENKQREQQAKQNQYDDRNKQDTPPPPPKQQQQQQQPPSQGQGQSKEMDADLAASKIQASFKGYKTRKELDTKKKQQGQK